LDGTTLVIRIPMHFRRRGGRTRIVARDGSEIVPSNKPQADGALVKAPARAWRRLKAAELFKRTSSAGTGPSWLLVTSTACLMWTGSRFDAGCRLPKRSSRTIALRRFPI
jgi:hypothetical protein